MAKLINKLIDEVVNEAQKKVVWPDVFVNSETKKPFVPQNEEVQLLLDGKIPETFVYIAAPEGSGKSATLANITLNKIKRGTGGAFIAPTLPYAIKLFKEFRNWINWDLVIPAHRHMGNISWNPYRSIFSIVFTAEDGLDIELIFGAYGENPVYWEGSNWANICADEIRAIRSEQFMKVFSGRVRVPSRNGEAAQMIMGSTPVFKRDKKTGKAHWMYKFFGPIQENDPLLIFKKNLKIVTLSLEKNLHNLQENYIETRGSTLTEKEKAVFLRGEWGEDEDGDGFLESMDLWRRLYDSKLTYPKKKEENGDWSDAVVLAMDGAIKHDSFAIVGVSRNPKKRKDFAVRIAREFKPVNNKINFEEVENYIRKLTTTYNIVTIVYDIYQIYGMVERLKKEGIAWFQEFNQNKKRTLSDHFLFESIIEGRISHQNQKELFTHMSNADSKYDPETKKRRIIKKTDSQKIDLVVALGMAVFECDRLNL